MSRIKLRLEKMANEQQNSQVYKDFIRDLSNLSDNFEEILKNAFANDELYNIIMENDEITNVVAKLKELNHSIGIELLKL